MSTRRPQKPPPKLPLHLYPAQLRSFQCPRVYYRGSQVVKRFDIAGGQRGASRKDDPGNEGVAHVYRATARFALRGQLSGLICCRHIKMGDAALQVLPYQRFKAFLK